MLSLSQKLVPGIVGISTYVDAVYHREIQNAAMEATGAEGPINRLRTVTVALDFAQLLANLRSDRIDSAEEQVAEAAVALQAAGSDFIVVTSGTTSTLTGRARERTSIPFLDLAEAACAAVAVHGCETIGLLSTRHAAAGGIFQAAARQYGATLMVPRLETAEHVDKVIFNELVLGQVSEECVGVLDEAISELIADGADSIILGNTDMTLATDRLDDVATVPLIDSARAHARSAARVALDGGI